MFPMATTASRWFFFSTPSILTQLILTTHQFSIKQGFSLEKEMSKVTVSARCDLKGMLYKFYG